MTSLLPVTARLLIVAWLSLHATADALHAHAQAQAQAAEQARTTAAPAAASPAGPTAQADPATPATPTETLLELQSELIELRNAVHRNTEDDPAAALRGFLSRVLDLVESDTPLPWRSHGAWATLCDETMRVLRHHDNRSAADWQRLNERVTSAIDHAQSLDHAGEAPERALHNHTVLHRRLLVMLLHLLPADYAHGQLDQTHRQLILRGEPAELTAWLRDIQALAPETVMGDTLAPAIDPALRRAAERIVLELIADQRVSYQRRRSVVMTLASARHSSGQSPAAGRLLDSWMQAWPTEVQDDVDMKWRRFNIALFGEADRETAWHLLLKLQQLAAATGDNSRAAQLTGHAARHYYQLLPLGQMEYERNIRVEEQRYLNRRRNSTSASATAQP